jgi:hypothetical protein
MTGGRLDGALVHLAMAVVIFNVALNDDLKHSKN